MPRFADPLLGFLRRARIYGIRRTLLICMLDFACLGELVSLVAALLTSVTLRGDLLAPLAGAALGLAVSARGLWAWRTWKHRYGSPLAVARTIAHTRGPIRAQPLAQHSPHADMVLRHEILGATDLWLLDANASQSTTGSRELARRYVDMIGGQVEALQASRAVPSANWRGRMLMAVLLTMAGLASWSWPSGRVGFDLLARASDGRPPRPAEPIWSELSLEITYPEHTGRPARSVPNPSGTLRVPAGTHVAVDITTRESADAVRILVVHDASEVAHAPEPEQHELTSADDAGNHTRFTGSFVVRGSGTWTVVLLDDPDDPIAVASRRSEALRLELEPDRAPEIELLPLADQERNAKHSDQVELRFVARDDFGLRNATLAYELPDGTIARVAAGDAPQPTRLWRHRHAWDLSTIPLENRPQIAYWIEIRDNDPGLGIVPLPEPPGKVTRSAIMHLSVQDDEAEHARNILGVQQLRDAAVDLLGARMISAAFRDSRADMGEPQPLQQVVDAGPANPDDSLHTAGPEVRQLQHARDLTAKAANLLAMLAAAIDRLAMDTLARERDIATLTSIHRRLLQSHRREQTLHVRVPPQSELTHPERAITLLGDLARHNVREITQLEDEIIRLDDLVDNQVLERIEAVIARVQASQQKLVELLEQLKAGDESVRGAIEQLQQKIHEDLRRIAEARAMLEKEVGQEFMNLDAFQTMERMLAQQRASELARQGEVDKALERARDALREIQHMRDNVQQRLAEPGNPRMSPEDEARMQLLRELSRIQDEQGGVRAETKVVHERWREAVQHMQATRNSVTEASRSAEELSKSLERINDARLAREARTALEDAKQALQHLESLGKRDKVGALELAETAEAVRGALERASAGSPANDADTRAVERAGKHADQLARRLDGVVPTAKDVLSEQDVTKLQTLETRQRGLRERGEGLLDSRVSDPLSEHGRAALKSASRAMDRSAAELGAHDPARAMFGQDQAFGHIQRAIDSLRTSSPPPSSSPTGEVSTETERDRSLRDELVDAMKEGSPAGFDEAVKRYYEELLR